MKDTVTEIVTTALVLLVALLVLSPLLWLTVRALRWALG